MCSTSSAGWGPTGDEPAAGTRFHPQNLELDGGRDVKRVKRLSPFRMRKRPECGSIRRTFRSSEGESTSPGASAGGGGGGGGGGVRTASLPVGGALVKECADKRPVSAHSILNSVTRHSSLKTKVLRRFWSTSNCQLVTGQHGGRSGRCRNPRQTLA